MSRLNQQQNMYAFTKPFTTRSIRKNKQKASRRARENKYWEEWTKNWYFRHERLSITFRLWSNKNKYKYNKPTLWVDVAKGKRASLPDFMRKINIYDLKKVLHCLSMRDIAWSIYNELINLSYEEYDQAAKTRQKKQKEEKMKYLEYLEWEEPSPRRKRKRCLRYVKM